MATRVRDILLRIRGDASDAERDLHDLAREVKDFGDIKAEATLDVDASPAERKIDAAKESVREFGRLSEEARVDLQTRAAEAKLERLRGDLDRLQSREASPKVDIAIGSTIAKIERIEASLDRLDRRRVDVDVDVDRRGSGAGRIGAAVAVGAGAAAVGINQGVQALGLFISAASRGIPIIGGIGQLFVQLGISGAALGPIFLVLVPIIGVALVGAFALLAGAAAALAASLLSAAAAVGVLGVTLAATFGPVVLVAIAAMARFAKILEAVKAAEDGHADAAKRVRDAQEQQASAQQAAADAAERVRTTTVEAYRAWQQAAEDVSDAIRGIQQAELSRDQARLNVKKAERDLADFRKEAGLTGDELGRMFEKFTDVSFRPQNLIRAITRSALGRAGAEQGVDPLELQQKILDVRQARLSEQDAIDSVSDAHTRLDEARAREQQFIQQGIAAYEPYTAAVKANTEAQKALHDATEKTNDARRKQNEALKGLTPTERTLVSTLVGLKKALQDLLRPATDAVFRGVIAFLRDVGDFAKDPRVRSGFTAIGNALGDAFRVLGRELRRRETRETFGELARGAARLVRVLSTDVFRSVFRILLRLAREALPFLESTVRAIGRFLRNIANDGDGVESFVRRVRRSFNQWREVAKQLWGVIKEFFGDANDSGDKLAGKIADILRDFRRWLHENPDAVRQFFRTAVSFASSLADSMERIASAMQTIASLANTVKDVYTFTSTGGQLDVTAEAQGQDRVNIAQLRYLIHRSRGRRRQELIKLLYDTYGVRYQRGGLVRQLFGSGGDDEPIFATPGEYVLRRSVVQSIGLPVLNALNAGRLQPAAAGVHIDNINLPPAPGHNQMGDARHQAVMLARELRRRGGQGVGGAGVQ